jgi:hypothetical protein
MRAPLLIEFVGLPGAGKSKTARLVLERLRRDGIACGDADVRVAGFRRWVHGVRFALFCVARWRLVVAAARYGLGVRPRIGERGRHLRALLIAAFSLRLHRARPLDVVVLEQGVLQDVWSLSVPGTPPPRRLLETLLAALLEELDGSLALVYLEADTTTALQRIASRRGRKSRFDRMPASEARRLLVPLSAHLEEIVECAVRITRVLCRRVDANAAPSERCVQVMAFVQSLLAGERPAAAASAGTTGPGAESAVPDIVHSHAGANDA